MKSPRRTITVTAAFAFATVAAVSGCSTSTTPQTTVTVTATPTVTQVAPPAPAEPEPAAPEPEVLETKVRVPNGVGLDYQSAQDKWRGAGLVVVPATDATGQNRLMILDANWVVLSQSPKAGTKVEEGSEIKATVKKYTD